MLVFSYFSLSLKPQYRHEALYLLLCCLCLYDQILYEIRTLYLKSESEYIYTPIYYFYKYKGTIHEIIEY